MIQNCNMRYQYRTSTFNVRALKIYMSEMRIIFIAIFTSYIKNQNYIVQESICNICRLDSIVQNKLYLI